MYTQAKWTDAVAGRTLVLTLLLLFGIWLLAPATTWAEDTSKDEKDEPVLKGAEKKAHDAKVKEHMAHLLDRKTQDILEGKIREIGGLRTRAARDALIKFTIGRKSKRYVKVALFELGGIGGKVAIEFLLSKHALKSGDAIVAVYGADGLARSADPRATASLLDVMTNRRTKIIVVGACATALAACAARDEKSVEIVLTYSRHKKASIRGPVVEALGHFRTDKASTRLKEALTSDSNAEVRAAAATGFGHAGQSDAVDLLRQVIQSDKSSTVRAACQAAIIKIQG